MIPRRTVLTLGVSQLVCWGISYYLVGVFGDAIAAELGWSRSLVHGGFSAALLVMALSSRVAGALIDRHGGRRVMAAGSVLIAAGCLGLAGARSVATFVHEASLRLEAGADPRAPGAAVTVELCGHWEHEGPCRWPHLSTIAERAGEEVTLRVLFAAGAADEDEVRLRIARALRRGGLEDAPRPSAWTLLREAPSELRADDEPAATHLRTR